MMTFTQYLLGKLAEEATEVAKIALKAQQFGLDEVEAGQTLHNKDRIHAELNDLNGIIKMLNEMCHFNYKPDNNAMIRKELKVRRYHAVSRKLGMVE